MLREAQCGPVALRACLVECQVVHGMASRPPRARHLNALLPCGAQWAGERQHTSAEQALERAATALCAVKCTLRLQVYPAAFGAGLNGICQFGLESLLVYSRSPRQYLGLVLKEGKRVH